ncbi:integral membrane protein [Podospora fimiseda]|uniref:Integral membrane protein n=1 Tax=Podospora fimiseda TaxID=252190 RepID=A0AAN7BXW8_9PEZI|nr:integral membrane protein [Podospora fimiseda]
MASANLPGDNRAYQIQAPCIVFFVLTPFFVVVRLWARIKLRGWKGLGWDDWSILASSVFATIVSVLMMAACSYGFGQHIANLTRPNKLMTLKLFYVAQALYKLSINLTKTSILLLYLRIFPSKWFRITCYALITLIILYMIGTTASSIWQCTPVPKAWDKSLPGTCISITSNWYANAGFSIATDIIILALPMHPIYSSKLPKAQKSALIIVFALGLFTTITSILRMQTLSFSSTSPDITYAIDSSIWTMIEVQLAIICACLPVCRLPLGYLLPAYFSSSSRSRDTGTETGASSYYSASYSKKSRRIIISNNNNNDCLDDEGGSTRELATLSCSPGETHPGVEVDFERKEEGMPKGGFVQVGPGRPRLPMRVSSLGNGRG